MARHGLTSAQYQATFDDLVGKGYRLLPNRWKITVPYGTLRERGASRREIILSFCILQSRTRSLGFTRVRLSSTRYA
ncbi:MAG: hypothetical protein ACSI46_01055 [Gloeotrichia echinulata DVL01]